MGTGNVCVLGKCEGLYYVDNNFLDVYVRKNGDGNFDFACLRDADETFEYNEELSLDDREWFEYKFIENFSRRFPSFWFEEKWISNTRRTILENKLFYIVLEDNQWSLAVELIQKDSEYGGEEKLGLQMGLYKNISKELKKSCLICTER